MDKYKKKIVPELNLMVTYYIKKKYNRSAIQIKKHYVYEKYCEFKKGKKYV